MLRHVVTDSCHGRLHSLGFSEHAARGVYRKGSSSSLSQRMMPLSDVNTNALTGFVFHFQMAG